MKNKKEKYISKEVLIKQYGWTEKLIEDFLSSHSRSSFPISLIEETMETEGFKKRFEKNSEEKTKEIRGETKNTGREEKEEEGKRRKKQGERVPLSIRYRKNDRAGEND